jgi:hypothetical protein
MTKNGGGFHNLLQFNELGIGPMRYKVIHLQNIQCDASGGNYSRTEK